MGDYGSTRLTEPVSRSAVAGYVFAASFYWHLSSLNADGFEGTWSVGSFPANGFGLYAVCGNVWEWTSDRFTVTHEEKPCCALPARDGERFPRKLIKGGSHLCAPNYCFRYRPAARQGEGLDTSTWRIGFRCVTRG